MLVPKRNPEKRGTAMTTTSQTAGSDVDVVVIGGGPAGLQAAMTLGRVHRTVLLADSGAYRNEAARQMHNFVTHDGTPPEEFRAAARAQLTAYPSVRLHGSEVSRVSPDETGGWEVHLGDGQVVRARKVILATGLRDTLPHTPGLGELWGDVVAHCPYCHGHEFSGHPVGILGAANPGVVMLSSIMARIASRVVVFADGGDVDPEVAAQLDGLGVQVRPEPVTGVCPDSLGASVELGSGPAEPVGGLFVSTTLTQAAPFAEQLGLEMLGSGCISVDEFGRTSREGIFAAGDLAHLPALPMPLASVLTAAAAGMVAASAANMALASEDAAVQPVG
jgi:thioredoxin reductase